MDRINTVAMIGLGAIGSFFADKIQPAMGDAFRVIANGERAERLKVKGMCINGERRFFHVVSSCEDGGYADLVLVCTKMTGLRQALADIRGQVGPETVIMTPQNGVESEAAASEIYGQENVLYSLMRVSSVKNGNQVTFDPATSFVEFGEKINHPKCLSEKVLRVQEFFTRVGIRTVIREDMERAIWEKYVCNVSENQVAAVLDIPFGTWGSCEDADKLRLMVADEVIQIANKKGIMIEPDYAKKHLEYLKKLPKGNKPSTLQDILAGRKTEVETFAGTVLRMGKETGVPTPYNEFLYHAIKVLEAKQETE